MSLENMRDWVGRTRAVEDFAAPFPVRALIATFDEDDPESPLPAKASTPPAELYDHEDEPPS